jgi:hypothetical protein
MKLREGTVDTLISLSKRKWEVDSKLINKTDNESSLENPYHKILYHIVQNLDPQVRAELVALLLIGRGDTQANDFEKIVKDISDTRMIDDYVWIIAKPIHEYLHLAVENIKKAA